MKKLIHVWTLLLTVLTVSAQTPVTATKDTIVPATPASEAQPDGNGWSAPRLRAWAGGFLPINNTSVKVENKDGSIGTEIDFEDDLGFDETTLSFMGGFQWRISKRSRLDFEYFALLRRARKVIDRDIEFGDNVYPVNGEVSAYFDTHIVRFSYGYAIIAKPKYEIGLLIGAHVLFTKVGLELETGSGSIGVNDDFGFTAPLPDAGIWAEIVLAKKLDLYVNGNYLAAQIGDIDGSIASFNVAVSYEVINNLDVSLGYSGLNFDLEVDKPRAIGNLEWGYNGFTLSAAYSFGGRIEFHKK